MTGYMAFTKKEFVENLRNYKLFSMLVLFLIFGFLCPLSAKFMPEILDNLATDFAIALAAPTALDSWEQFYGNISGLGMSLMLIIYCSLLSSEYAKGTLVIMLTKGLSRPAVILSKFSVTTVIMTFCFWASFLINYGYTLYFWPDTVLPHILLAAMALWMIGMMYLSILILGCVLFKQAFASILFLLGNITLMSLLSIPKQLENYSPTVLSSKNLDLISEAMTTSELVVPIIFTLMITIGCLIAAVVLFDKKQI